MEIIPPLNIQMLSKYDTINEKPLKKVSIIVSTYNEAEFIERCCVSIRNQKIIKEYPNLFEFIIADSNSIDGTVDIARPYVDRIIMTGRGKLTSRNEATDQCNGDIIVSIDGDCIYLPYWLNTLIKPLGKYEGKEIERNRIIATCGSSVDLFSYITAGDYLFNNTVRYRMMGRNSAYFKESFYAVGGFKTDINQNDPSSIISEEEIGFGRRLSKIGKVKYVKGAGCIHLGSNKILCRGSGLLNGLIPLGNQCQMYKFGIDRY